MDKSSSENNSADSCDPQPNKKFKPNEPASVQENVQPDEGPNVENSHPCPEKLSTKDDVDLVDPSDIQKTDGTNETTITTRDPLECMDTSENFKNLENDPNLNQNQNNSNSVLKAALEKCPTNNSNPTNDDDDTSTNNVIIEGSVPSPMVLGKNVDKNIENYGIVLTPAGIATKPGVAAQQGVAAQSGVATQPIILRKVVNLPPEVLKQFKQNRKSVMLTSSNHPKLLPILPKPQQIILGTNPIKSTLRIMQKNNKEDDKGDPKKKLLGRDDYSCAASGCHNKASHYFRVPRDDKRLRIWKYCVRNPKLDCSDVICQEHFITEDIVDRQPHNPIGTLKEHAVPSLIKVLHGCCIPQCINQHKNTPNRYAIPVWGNFTPWLNYMGKIKLTVAKLHDLLQFRVCERHFLDSDRKSKVFDMVPTRNLPSKEYYEEQMQKSAQGKISQNPKEIPDVNDASKVAEHSKLFCAFLGCTSSKKEAYIKFYNFPYYSYKRSLQWLEACKRQDILKKSQEEITKFIIDAIGVCFKHKNEIERIIHRNESNPNSKQEAAEVGKPGDNIPLNKIIYVPTREYCAFVNCSSSIKDPVKKYRFPADPDLLAQWIEASGIPQMLFEEVIRTLFVCGKHFCKEQYNELGTLILSSVPGSHTSFVDTDPHEGNEHWAMKQKKTQKPFSSILKKPDPPPNTSNKTVVSEKPKVSVVPEKPKVNVVPEKPQPTFSVTKVERKPEIPKEIKCAIKHCPSRRDGIKCNLYSFPHRSREVGRFTHWIKALENRAFVSPEAIEEYENKKICERHFERRYKIGNNLLRTDAVPTLNLFIETTAVDKDTSIVWQEYPVDYFDKDAVDPNKAPYIRGNAILRENSIEFPNISRELKFGKDCPKLGRNKFPYKLFKVKKQVNGMQVDAINPGHRLQIHTAIIVDDDDESEREAISVIQRIIKQNADIIPKNRNSI